MKATSLLLAAAGLLSFIKRAHHKIHWSFVTQTHCPLLRRNLYEDADSVLWTWEFRGIPSEWAAELTDSSLNIASASAAFSGIYELVQYTTVISDTDTVAVSSIAGAWEVSVLDPFQLIVPDPTLSICPEVDSTTFYPCLPPADQAVSNGIGSSNHLTPPTNGTTPTPPQLR